MRSSGQPERLADALEAEGFQLTRDAGGIPNAFIASVGEGQPVIALLGEFDALAGLSQQAHSAEPRPRHREPTATAVGTICSAPRHSPRRSPPKAGCSSTATAALCASTVVPARKAVREKPLWCAKGCLMMSMRPLTWHPEAWAGMFSTRTLANIQAAWRFTGTAAHAANSPHLGRSALDAVTLMTTGSNFLNEHIIEKARVHYAHYRYRRRLAQRGAGAGGSAVFDPRAGDGRR